ncbi:MAG: hypothetical protein ACRDI2_00420 [Chloroflexota bacterium]
MAAVPGSSAGASDLDGGASNVGSRETAPAAWDTPMTAAAHPVADAAPGSDPAAPSGGPEGSAAAGGRAAPAPPGETPPAADIPTSASTIVPLSEAFAGSPVAASFALPNGQPLRLMVDAAALRTLQESLPPQTRMEMVFDPAPPTANAVQDGSLGGGSVTPASGPVSIRVRLMDNAGREVRPAQPGEGDATFTLVLPVLFQPPETDAVFAWLQAIYDDGQFVGYIRPSAAFDAATGAVRIAVSADAVDRERGTLFLPVVLRPAYVQNFDPAVHIYSGPDDKAVDYGVAGPQFTTFVVVAPQVGQRLFVYNPTTDNYGWIDAAGVGPVGPPQP